MKYVNLTPRWTEILSVWQRVVDHNSRHRVNRREENIKAMKDFWAEMQRMAQGADNYNDLVTYLRKFRGWKDDRLSQAIAAGREQNEIERNTIKESKDDLLPSM